MVIPGMVPGLMTADPRVRLLPSSENKTRTGVGVMDMMMSILIKHYLTNGVEVPENRACSVANNKRAFNQVILSGL